MREAMYGWVEKWLCDRGDGRPLNEPAIPVLDVASLRCYPEGRPRPKSIVTIPEFARDEGLQRLAALPKPPRTTKEPLDRRRRTDARCRDSGSDPGRVPAARSSGDRVQAGSRKNNVPDHNRKRHSGDRRGGRNGSGDRAGTEALLVKCIRRRAKTRRCLAAHSEESRQWNAAGLATLNVTDARILHRVRCQMWHRLRASRITIRRNGRSGWAGR